MNKDVAIATWHEGSSVSKVADEIQRQPRYWQSRRFWWGCILIGIGLLLEFLAPSFSRQHSIAPLLLLWGSFGCGPLTFWTRREAPSEENLLEDPSDLGQELVHLTIQKRRSIIGQDRGIAEVSDGTFSFSGHRTAFCFGEESLFRDYGMEPISYGYGKDEIKIWVNIPGGEMILTLTKLKRENRKYQAFGKDIYRPEPSFARLLFDLPDQREKSASPVVLPPTTPMPIVQKRTPSTEETLLSFRSGLLSPEPGLTRERRLVIIGAAFASTGLLIAYVLAHNWDTATSVSILSVFLAIHLIRNSALPANWIGERGPGSK